MFTRVKNFITWPWTRYQENKRFKKRMEELVGNRECCENRGLVSLDEPRLNADFVDAVIDEFRAPTRIAGLRARTDGVLFARDTDRH